MVKYVLSRILEYYLINNPGIHICAHFELGYSKIDNHNLYIFSNRFLVGLSLVRLFLTEYPCCPEQEGYNK